MSKGFSQRETKTKRILMLLAEIGMINLGRSKYLIGNRKINAATSKKFKEILKIAFEISSNLASRKIVSRKKEADGSITIRLTEKGKQIVLRYKINDIRLIRQPHWNGIWHVISYDIPKTYNRDSKSFARRLHAAGFFRLQKSIWISPWECANEVSALCNAGVNSLEEFLCYIKAFDIPNQAEIKKFFGI